MKYAFLLLSFIPFLKSIGQELDTSNAQKLSIFPFPVVYYTPETRFAFGGVGLFSFRFKGETEESRNSQFQLGGAYTQEDQLLFYLPFQLYKKNEKYYFSGELGYYNYNYFFYGVGDNTPQENEELYDVNFPRIRFNAMKLVRPSFYFGMRYWFDEYDIVGIKEGGLLSHNKIVGSAGGTISSLGLIALFDNRDNYNYPSKGEYLEILTLPNLYAFGSDFEFTRFSVDFVKYLSYGKNTLALNFFGVSILGEAPFNELAFIGGTRKMRGYYEGRFRDRNLLMSQVEYRRRLIGRFGITAFLGYGVIARVPEEFQVQDIKGSGGLGLRFRLDEAEKINLRLDYGVGEAGNSGFYLTIGEAF